MERAEEGGETEGGAEEKKGKRDSCGEEEFLPRTKALRFCAILLFLSIFSRVGKAYASKHVGGGGKL